MKPGRPYWIALAVAAPAALALAPAVTGAPAGHAAKTRCAHTVDVKTGDDPAGNLFFKKHRVTIYEGSCVRWVFTGELDHQVKGKGFKSKLRAAPYRYRRRFSTPRKRAFQIICTQHSLSMRMKVKVLAKAP